MKVSEVVKQYIDLRDQKAELAAKSRELDAEMERIEAKLLAVFDSAGVDSVSTEFGTAYSTNRSYVSIADKEAFMNHVRENEDWPLLEVRPSKTAVTQYKEATGGELPPGVNWREEIVVNIRR